MSRGKPTEELVCLSIEELLALLERSFTETAVAVLERNAALYDRLACRTLTAAKSAAQPGLSEAVFVVRLIDPNPAALDHPEPSPDVLALQAADQSSDGVEEVRQGRPLRKAQ